METYIAIDNVCAWPNIKRLPQGEIAAVIFNQPCHLHWEGTLDCWVSSDNGRFWEFCSHPVVNEPGKNRGNAAVGLNRAGELIVICSGWAPVLPKPERAVQGCVNDDTIKQSFVGRTPLWPVCSISRDNGRTWTTQDIKMEGAKADTLWVPYGDIMVLANGNLGCSMYGFDRKAFIDQGQKLGSFFMESPDNGLTWICRACIHAQGNEATCVRLPSGKLMAAVRSTHLDLFESVDEGRTWRHVTFLTGRNEYPAGFTLLKEGYLLLTYGIRLNGLYGIGGRLMSLDSEEWRHTPMVLADFGATRDGGYPSNAQLDNGEIVTAYYAKSVPNHNRYHMGVLIWSLKEKGY